MIFYIELIFIYVSFYILYYIYENDIDMAQITLYIKIIFYYFIINNMSSV